MKVKPPSHAEQLAIWEREHSNPKVLLQMDSYEPSSGVTLFWSWLKERKDTSNIQALEMGCGKGRNCIWLAQQGVQMCGFDFSTFAIDEAKRRAALAGVDKVHFQVHDATTRWPFVESEFDFAVDCFASTDIELPALRETALKEFRRVLKPNGYLFVYTLSVDDGYHRLMLEKSPTSEANSFRHSENGKFEKVFSEAEIMDLYSGWKLVEMRRISKSATFKNELYSCAHFWLVLLPI